MNYRTLGRTGLEVSRLGFGTGGPSILGQPLELPRSEQVSLIRRCLDLGINLFDTSPSYGQSEEILGHGLEGVPRDGYILSTKWPHAPSGSIETDPRAMVRSVENSLRLLRTDYLDIFLFHGLGPDQYDQVVERFLPELQSLQRAGKVRFIGFSQRFISDLHSESVVHGLRNHPTLWDVVMLKYGILNQYADREALPLALEKQVGVLNMAAVRIKLPDPERLESLIQDWKNRGLIPRDSLSSKNPLGWLIHHSVHSVIDAAYRFAADHAAVASVLTGTANPTHLDQNVISIEGPSLPSSDKKRLRDLFGKIAEYV